MSDVCVQHTESDELGKDHTSSGLGTALTAHAWLRQQRWEPGVRTARADQAHTQTRTVRRMALRGRQKKVGPPCHQTLSAWAFETKMRDGFPSMSPGPCKTGREPAYVCAWKAFSVSRQREGCCLEKGVVKQRWGTLWVRVAGPQRQVLGAEKRLPGVTTSSLFIKSSISKLHTFPGILFFDLKKK